FVRKLMRNVEKAGFRVELHGTVADFEAALAEKEDLDLAVIDLLVPQAPDQSGQKYAGLSALKAVARDRRRIPILVFSVVQTREILEEVRRYTPHILFKPTRRKEFEDKVLELVGARRAAAEDEQ